MATILRGAGSKAASSAAAKLQELGIAYGTAPAETTAQAPAPTMTSSARVLAFEVGQYASIELSGQPAAITAQAGSRAIIPFELVNTGNGPDSFRFSTPAAAELNPVFAAASAPDAPLPDRPR